MKRIFIFSVSLAIAARALASLSGAEWISVPDAPVFSGPVKGDSRAAPGTSWFVRAFTNSGWVASAKWTVSGLGVFDVFVNGKRVGDFRRGGAGMKGLFLPFINLRAMSGTRSMPDSAATAVPANGRFTIAVSPERLILTVFGSFCARKMLHRTEHT